MITKQWVREHWWTSAKVLGTLFYVLFPSLVHCGFLVNPAKIGKIGENWCYGFVFCITVLTVRGRQVGADEREDMGRHYT